MTDYKTYLRVGDEAIPRSTIHRYSITEEDVIVNAEERIDPNADNVFPNASDFMDVGEHANDQFEDVQFLNDEQNINDNIAGTDEDGFGNFLKEIYCDTPANCHLSPKNQKNLQEFIESETFSTRVTADVDKTIGEIFLMIVVYSLSNSLSQTAMTNLFKLINAIFCEPIMPNSSYMIDKMINPKEGVEFHAVCHNCTAYIGKFGERETRIKHCRICQASLDLANSSNASYFVSIDPSRQISDLLHSNDNYYDYVVNERQIQQNHITDIYDGKSYRKFLSSIPKEDKQKYVTSIVNTDGASKFKCSQYSIWPIFLMLNELPPQLRITNLITCGLWFHRRKPDMNVFLNPFVDIINGLSCHGISCIIKGQEIIVKLYTLICCVDSVARAPMQGIKQFNGYYGCSWCLHPGEWSDGSMKYPILSEIVESRKHETTVSEMFQATAANSINGIRSPSAFINLEFFNIITGFVPDYLHCCLEGIAKQFVEYYISSMQLDGITIEFLDSAMLNVSVPRQISRLIRPLSLRKDWKAREWENFIIYISVPLFLTKLNNKLLKHWLLFVESLFILLKDDICITELNHADEMLHLFVVESEEYFGKKSMTYNLHQMLHLSQSVLNWGPLWAHSTYPFESGNHQLLKAIKCARGVTQQIVRYVSINNSVLTLKCKVLSIASDTIKFYCDDILTSKLVNTVKIAGITYFGKGTDFNVDNIVTAELNLSDTSKSFLRMSKDGSLFVSHFTTCRINRKSNDSYAQLNDNRFIHILNFIVDTENNQQYTLCKRIFTRNCFRNFYQNLQKVESIDDEVIVVPTMSIKKICVFLEIHNRKYICSLPNILHY